MMIRIYNEDGSNSCLTYKKKSEGMLLVNSSFYDKNGYYDASKGFDGEISEVAFNQEIRAAKALGLKVKVFE